MDFSESKVREIKAAGVARLRAGLAEWRASLSQFADADASDWLERLCAYFDGVSEDPDAHNTWEVMACVKFFRLAERYEFRASAVTDFVHFYESLKFSGVDGRRSYRLTGVQIFQFASMLGFYDEDGLRLVRDAFLFVPRKFSKTTSVASLAVYELLKGDLNAQAYTCANSYKQAQVAFREIRSLLKQLDPDKKHFKLTRERAEWRAGNKWGRESVVECLTGGGDTKDGLAASLVIYDEFAQAKYVRGRSEGAELLQVMKSSMGTRRAPLSVIITTASRVQDSPCTVMLDNGRAELAGEYENDRAFFSIFEPDPWDAPNIGTEAVWRKCNPHIGVTVLPQFYANSWADAQRDGEAMLEFKSKLLNIFVAQSVTQWVEGDLVRSLMTAESVAEMNGRPKAMCAIDLSVSDDFSAVSYVVHDGEARRFFVETDYYIPAETLAKHANRALYGYWVERGWLKVCEGAVIDGRLIIADILRRNEQLCILQIGYDAYKSQEVVNALAGTIGARAAKRVLRAVPQTYGAFTSPVETFEMAVKRNPPACYFHANPMQAWCFGNAFLDVDKMGNKKPLKMREDTKIDSVITTLMGFWLWNNTPL